MSLQQGSRGSWLISLLALIGGAFVCAGIGLVVYLGLHNAVTGPVKPGATFAVTALQSSALPVDAVPATTESPSPPLATTAAPALAPSDTATPPLTPSSTSTPLPTTAAPPTAPAPTYTPTQPPRPTQTPSTSPTASGPGGRIVFICNVGGKSEICVISGDGSGRKQLTQSGGAGNPTLSHNGESIVFDCWVSSKVSEICRMNADGTGRVQLTHQGADSLMPVYSPDDQSIAYASNVGAVQGVPYQIWVMHSDGSNANAVTTVASNADPAWSHDGRFLSFASTRTAGLQLWYANSDGSNPRVFTSGLGVNQRHSWSPDGHTIAYSAGRPGPNSIFLINIDGTGRRQLTSTGDNDHPAFSPDGQWIVFVAHANGGTQLDFMMSDGTNITRLTAGVDTQPYWGP